ncbi:EAL domain-containing protein [Limoniibacter endophyticus]|uniref:Diguanylate phosphodiesterase n=1 Tax=Limoniibacter endophyticus TaxID=1565040 RepID=A0A8J3DGU0_9HYPH|nr:EAL domain-containing protein [Limoniibacter endophyticus]GHC65895.1 diguanylate phosphodiesterase [Limoniibacter endophyticus]
MNANDRLEMRRAPDGTYFASTTKYALHTALQPIFLVEEEKLVCVAYEALVRASDPTQMASETFFENLPRHERHVVERVTREIHLRNAAAYLGHGKGIFINFNPALFNLPNIETSLIEDLQELATTAEVLAGNVVCEITEQKVSAPKMLTGIVTAMRQAGFAIAVDDFGADQSDLERVRIVDPDVVKFDGAWVQARMSSPEGRRHLTGQVTAFREDGRLVLLEGIEQNWQIEAAAEAGAQLLQGFGLARPQVVPAQFPGSIGYKNKFKAVAKRTVETGEAKTIKWNIRPRSQSG